MSNFFPRALERVFVENNSPGGGGRVVVENIYPLKKEEFSTQLLQLAKKMRMNTEQRKNIFCLIMSSEDYIEATERSVLVIC